MSSLGGITGIAQAYETIPEPQPMMPRVRSRTALRAEVAVHGGALLSERHLVVPGDNGRQAPMGAVHLVQLGANPHDKHFMHDIEGDVNEGQKLLVTKGRRGPFAAQ